MCRPKPRYFLLENILLYTKRLLRLERFDQLQWDFLLVGTKEHLR